MPKHNPFSHFHQETQQDQYAGMTPFAKKVLVVLFVFFLLLFPRYAPWAPHYAQDDTLLYQIFTLYFFIISQTLGIVHEAGHGVCYIVSCPEFVMVVNGTLFQLLFPGLIAYYYYKKGNRFAAWIGLFFLGLSLSYSAWYLSTAHEGALLPAHKSFLGVDAIHDFHYMLSAMGLLAYESLLVSLTRLMAYLLMGISVLGMFLDAFSNHDKRRTIKNRGLK